MRRWWWRATNGISCRSAYVDRVLGDTLAKLKSARIYDDALVIVAADHGCSFHPGGSRRALRPANWADVLRVPLLVKLPAQQTGIVSDRAVETIDILPTIATVLDAPLPFAVDGISMLPETDRPSVKRTAISDQGEEFSVPDTLAGLQESASRKTNLFGSGADTRKLFGAGRFWRLVDQPVARLQAAPAADLRATIQTWSGSRPSHQKRDSCRRSSKARSRAVRFTATRRSSPWRLTGSCAPSRRLPAAVSRARFRPSCRKHPS